MAIVGHYKLTAWFPQEINSKYRGKHYSLKVLREVLTKYNQLQKKKSLGDSWKNQNTDCIYNDIKELLLRSDNVYWQVLFSFVFNF